MKKIVLSIFLFSLLLGATANTPINKDRWLEIDLYWFSKNDMQGSSDYFWRRIHPLFADISGDKGVILNIGWLMDFVLEWNGSLDAQIPFPKGMTIWEMFDDEGYILGNTEQRIEHWRNRLANARKRETVEYENWTYKDLRNFITIFKRTAARYGIRDIKVGTFVIAWKNIYDGNISKFAEKHPDAFSNISYFNPFNPTCILSEDKSRYGAYPNGIPDGLPITKFFGDQWGDMSKKTGLDAIVLRDAAIGQYVYFRMGPVGKFAPADPAEVAKWSKATADLIRHTKQANPNALVIGYSNGGAAVGDWRVNCFDLEAIAHEGYLDAYIDQSWAGAWNEVGQRPGNFWNNQHMGWTYQLSYILLHGAILSKTPTKHYFLTETFDAWETWNAINCARERLRWCIWAFSHAAVKTPNGLKFPDGSYISWGNQVKRLLSNEEVNFLVTETNNAFRNLDNIADINGPTLVYSRSAMEWQSANDPATWMKEWIDDYAGSVMKFGAPILSAARIEDLNEIESDMFIVQTPIHLKTEEKAQLENIINSGKPVLIIGSPANGIDVDILRRAGLSSLDKSPEQERNIGIINNINHPFAKNCPRTFPLYHPFTRNRLDANSNTEVFYSVSYSPALVRKDNLSIWDPPELYIYSAAGAPKVDIATDILLGSVVPHVLTARLVNDELLKAGKFSAYSPDIYLPVWCGSWTTKSGDLVVLIADLEEGLEHTGKELSSIEMILPPSFAGKYTLMSEKWRSNTYIIPVNENVIEYSLKRGESRLLIFGR